MHVVFVLFVAITLIQLCYYLFIFSQFSFVKQKKKQSSTISISVLICARNEAENIQSYLPSILSQNYTNFELILINDGSADETLPIFKAFKEKYKTTHQIKIVDVAQNSSSTGNKKHALTRGIEVASYEYLLFTDADCQSASKNWISEMSRQFSEGKEIILGYGAHRKIENSQLNKLIRFETLYTAIQYLSYAKIGLAYMGVGRNLAYKKSLFLKANGFTHHKHIKSGDDDLLINEISTKNNTGIVFSSDSFTVSEPKTSLKDWILQKRRHISTATHYKFIHKLLLGLSYSTQLLFLTLGIFLLMLDYKIDLVLIIIGIRLFVQYCIIGMSAIKLKEKDLILWIPFFELFLIFIQLFIFIKNKISKPTHW